MGVSERNEKNEVLKTFAIPENFDCLNFDIESYVL